MKLYEFEAKHLLAQYGFSLPKSHLVSSSDQLTLPPFSGPYVLKAQLLSGNRAARGGILFVTKSSQLPIGLKRLFRTKFGLESVKSVLVEEQITSKKEFYLALTYSTESRSPLLLFSDSGGSGVEKRRHQLQSYPLSLNQPKFPDLPVPPDFLAKLFHLFLEEDIRLLEINPLIETIEHTWLALDAKIILDEAAFFRHPNRHFPPRSFLGRLPTDKELEANQVNKMDHRGSAGASYFDFGSGVGVLASGGGASIVIMDTLLANDLKPANYTEYSGNPPREKVKALTKVVLSQSLNSLLVVGGNANFTDIYETLMGVVDAILECQPLPKYPIVIRRGGPRWQEAFATLTKIKQSHHLNLHLFGPDVPMSFAVDYLVKLLKPTL